ncbi:MAG: HAMP domain-containing protein [Nitrospirae bacterium]|nr:HAMP domain-containing protein [Nitrospirota bacterium]
MSPSNNKFVQPGNGFDNGLSSFLFKRRVQLSLFFFIPLFLILFSLAPTYIAVALVSRAVLSSEKFGPVAALAGFHASITGMIPVFLIIGLIALAAGLFIAYALVQPVKRLQEAIHSVTIGDFRADLRLDATGEFAYLGRDFNRMVSKLAMQEQLQRTERLAALGTLAAGVAHEIRNPLGAVKGLAQLLQESADSPSERKYAETIVGEVNRLDTVVERLLRLARPASGLIEKVDLNRLVHDAVELCGYERNTKQITILQEYDQRISEILLDREAMLQAVLNVLRNAVQAIPGAGTIRVKTALRAKPDPSQARRVSIEIANTDSTIPPADYKRIFDPFYTTKEGGTGLGLAITHQVVTAQGGTIEVESGHGETVFAIELPVK